MSLISMHFDDYKNYKPAIISYQRYSTDLKCHRCKIFSPKINDFF